METPKAPQQVVRFYQNNPCVIIRDVNDKFCEIQLNTHFAANIEAEYYCTPSECRSPMSSGEAAQEEYDQAQAIIEEVQSEEHSIICMVEKRLLHDIPVEAATIISLQKDIDKRKAEFAQDKILHAEWVASIKAMKQQKEALKSELGGLELSVEAARNIRNTAEAGIKKLSEHFRICFKCFVKVSDLHQNNMLGVFAFNSFVFLYEF